MTLKGLYIFPFVKNKSILTYFFLKSPFGIMTACASLQIWHRYVKLQSGGVKYKDLVLEKRWELWFEYGSVKLTLKITDRYVAKFKIFYLTVRCDWLVTGARWFKPQVKSPRSMMAKGTALLQRFIFFFRGCWSVVVGGLPVFAHMTKTIKWDWHRLTSGLE